MGRRATTRDSASVSWTCSALTILREIYSWMAQTSSIPPEYFSAHRCESVSASMSWAVTRSARIPDRSAMISADGRALPQEGTTTRRTSR